MTRRDPEYAGDPAHTPKEVERKFLINPKQVPADLRDRVERELALKQGYIAVAADGSELRIRSTNAEGFELTVKSSGDMVRGESNIEITPEMFAALWPKTEGARVEKTRLQIPYGPQTIEVDIYDGELEGLVVAEVEFHGNEELGVSPERHAEDFVPPDWFDKEVTFDKAYKNKNLATRGLPS
ncbi:CYTH domain-containing protein [Mycobacterium sp. UM_CSW]|uniref:CYTH domain-containing protein n=1 Tax=Mycobacterium sp. UM_CSW TaxID=1370119 RepID=UPI00195547B0|nr:CYTH domain-containing protein [Mycobacterium sp. UM_CSW]